MIYFYRCNLKFDDGRMKCLKDPNSKLIPTMGFQYVLICSV